MQLKITSLADRLLLRYIPTPLPPVSSIFEDRVYPSILMFWLVIFVDRFFGLISVIAHISIFKLLSLTSNSECLFSRLSQFAYRYLKLLLFRLEHTFDLVVVVALSAMESLFVALLLLPVDRPLVGSSDRAVAGLFGLLSSCSEAFCQVPLKKNFS